jgi:hypothetical protein
MKISMVAYDIPTDCPLPNPSARLRRIGFRINLSTWAIPNHLMPYNLINEYTEAGAVFTPAVQFSADEAPKLAQMAVAALKREVAEAERAARDGQSAAVEAAEEDESGKARRRFKMRAAQNLSRARRLLRDAEDAANNLGVDVLSIGLYSANQTIRQLSSAAKTKAHVYAEMTARLRELADSDQTASEMASAAEADDMNPLVASDRLEELGECDLAESLREVFND